MAINPTNKKSTNQKSKHDINSNNGHNGLIKIDTGKLHLPAQLTEEQEKTKNSFWHIEPAILIIFTIALSFVGFISILISQMPAK